MADCQLFQLPVSDAKPPCLSRIRSDVSTCPQKRPRNLAEVKLGLGTNPELVERTLQILPPVPKPGRVKVPTDRTSVAAAAARALLQGVEAVWDRLARNEQGQKRARGAR